VSARRSGAVLNQRTGTPATASGKRSRCSQERTLARVRMNFFRPQNRDAAIQTFRRSSSSEDNASFFRFFNGFCSQSDRSITHADRDFDRKVTRRGYRNPLSLTGVRLIILIMHWGFPCCVRFPCVHAAATTPVQRLGVVLAHLTQSCQPSPEGSPGRPAHLLLARRSLALRPARSRGHRNS
jgi:hypothetical protein